MDSTIKQRLIGAAVLAALAVIFLPMLLKGPDVREPDAAEVPLSMPASPGQDYETRELPLTAPEGETPPGGVLGMAPAADSASAAIPIPDENAVATDATAPDAETATHVPAPAIPAATTTPAPPAVELPTASVAAGNYVVSIGSFSNLANANSLATKLRAAGLPVSADRVTIATGTAMRLRVGPYVDRASAEAARLRAETVTGASGKVIVLDAAPATPAAARVASAATPKPAPPASTTLTTPAPVAKPATAPTKPVTPGAAEPEKAVPLSAGFAVQLSAPSVETEALALRDRARAQGFSSFVQKIETEGGVRYRVRVGPVADRSAAETMRDAVNAKLGTKGIVVANP